MLTHAPADAFRSPAGLLQQALQLHRQGRLAEAEELYERVLGLDPGQFDALHMLGVVAGQTQRAPRAVQMLQRATAVRDDVPAAHYNLALALATVGRLEDAVVACDRVIALAPERVQAYDDKAELLHDLARPAGALAALERAMRIDPGRPLREWKAALCCLQLGDYERGWKLYSSRQAYMFGAGTDEQRRAARVRRERLWTGREDLDGRVLFVQSEQGLGDTLQFCRYVPLLEERGAEVILSVPQPLRRLLTGLSPRTRIVGDQEPRPEADFDCLLLSLPAALATTIDTIPARTPYLTAEAERVRLWRGRVASAGIKVGVCWQGKPGPADCGRSFPLRLLAPLAALPGVRLVSLQKEAAAARSAADAAAVRLQELGPDLDAAGDAFVDTAAVMQSLDLVITVDSAVAHLAGALGVRTWVALKFAPDWRWLLSREDSPWYPTVRLFRQPAIGDWGPVFEAMRRALGEINAAMASAAATQSSP